MDFQACPQAARYYITYLKLNRGSVADSLNNWLQNAMLIVARKRNIKLNPTHYSAHRLRQGGCTDMARRNTPSWRIEMTRRWS